MSLTTEEVRDLIDARVDERMEQIAETAAQKVITHFYEQVGKGVLRKAAWLIAVIVFGLLSWLAGKGYLPSP
jgi:hypothetical protein